MNGVKSIVSQQKWRAAFEWQRDFANKNNYMPLSKHEFSAHYQKLIYTGSESTEHIVLKAIVGSILFKRNRSCLSEPKFKLTKNMNKSRQPDWLDIDEKNRIEIVVTSYNPDDMNLNDIIIDANKMPLKIRTALSMLEKWVEEQVP